MSFDFKIKNGDLSLDDFGEPEKVFRYPKLKQDVIKILITDSGENFFHGAYGSDLGKVGSSNGMITSSSSVSDQLSGYARSALNKLILLQKNQSNYQYIDPEERLVAVKSVEAVRDSSDPRMWNLFISIKTGGLRVVEESLTIRVV